ncbi:RusA family crossover junction endodeoxyribonuclease [Sporosarcina sp. FSL K6-1540]
MKAIKDGLTKVIWQDDSQVVNLTVQNYYSLSPKVVVCIKY